MLFKKKKNNEIKEEINKDMSVGVNRKMFTHTDISGAVSALIYQYAYAESNDNINISFCSNSTVNEDIKSFILVEKGHEKFNEIVIADVAINNSVAVILDKITELGVEVKYFNHQECNLELNSYKWAQVETGSDTSSIMMKYYEIKNEFIAELSHKSESYTTWKWVETNDIVAKQLSDICHYESAKLFVRRMMKKLAENSPLIEKEEELLIEHINNDYQTYLKEKKEGLIVKAVHRDNVIYNIGCVFAENFINDIANDLIKQYKLDCIVIINGMKKVSFRTGRRLNAEELAKVIGGGGNKSAAGGTISSETQHEIVQELIDMYEWKASEV